MALKKLSTKVQTMLTSSLAVHSFKKAVEELVYNALDAHATSVSIRVNFQERKIQVIDNGSGISRCDLKLVGQKYVTSKLLDENALKSVPNVFGYQGQSLSSLIDVSKNVKITSRHEGSENTWLKAFHKGKEKDLYRCEVRPSKGTTVEINGFLYNLTIQEKLINYISDLQEIKLFLEQLSLVHSNVSISLRDDSKNEIIFKVHKNKDIYQTFLSLFEINREDVQELKVEKNLYKVEAYIGKTENCNDNHWIFLNKRFLPNCKLHAKVKEYISKYLKLKTKTRDKSKFKDQYDKEETYTNKIPFYYMFITCPYYDYDINYNSKLAQVEFKNWDLVNKLIDKLVAFFTGTGINLKNIRKINPVTNNEEIKKEVKIILDKFMSSNSKAIEVSKMHKGIKGKSIKRKVKEKTKIKKKAGNGHSKNLCFEKAKQLPPFKIKTDKTDLADNQAMGSIIQDFVEPPVKRKKIINVDNLNANASILIQKYKSKTNVIRNKQKSIKNNEKNKTLNKIKLFVKKKDPVIEKFERGSESVKLRCKILANKAKDLVSKYKEDKDGVAVSESIEHYNFVNKNKTLSIRKRVKEKIIHNILPLPPRTKDDVEFKNPNESSFDLIQTIEQFQHLKKDINSKPHNNETEIEGRNNFEMNNENVTPNSSLTYKSHRNYYHQKLAANQKPIRNNISNKFPKFITEGSRENFGKEIRIKKRKYTLLNQTKILQPKTFDAKKHSMFQDIQDSLSYSIECFQSNAISCEYNNIVQHSDDIDKTNKFQRKHTIFDHTDLHSPNQAEGIIACTFTLSNDSRKSHITVDDSNSEIYQTHYSKDNNLEKTLHDFDVMFLTGPEHKRHTDNNDVNVVHTEDRVPEIKRKISSSKNHKDVFITKANKLLNNIENEFSKDYQSYLENTDFFNGVPQDETDILLISNKVTSTSKDILTKRFNNEGKPVSQSPILYCKSTNASDLKRHNTSKTASEIAKHNDVNYMRDTHTFLFKNRLRFLPKGMSQIFRNCHSKTACDYNIEEDYFQNTLYNNFIKNIEIKAEVFKPKMQYVNEHTTKDIEKVHERLNKENAALVFNAASLKDAKVLGQVDEKFIAATITGVIKLTNECSNVLVLFDQHAVHERIRLEKSLSEYFVNNQWTSILLERVFSLKLSKDTIIFLHNYRNKFKQFGLDWTILNDNELEIRSIPEAIFGKNNRASEIIMKAVKSLIIEEITAIQSQKGCTSLYPKSIMDFVSSEACRYAIKFGDRLSKSVCANLIKSLSECHTPFQCAHGRPVMAVIMDVRKRHHEFSINYEKIKKLWNIRKKTNSVK